MTLNIGAHISISNGYTKAMEDALSIDSNTFQFFTRNPRGGAARAVNMEDISNLDRLLAENNFAPLLAHAPYTINMCSDSEDTRRGAKELISADLELMSKLPAHLYNIHPGSRKTESLESAFTHIAEAVNGCLMPEHSTYFLFETMSGKGSEMGVTFEEIREMIDRTELKEKTGVCLDTCHVFCAGYDIVNNLDDVLTHFDKVIGLDKLMAVHLNDTMNPLDSKKDRHAKIGQGHIGLDAIIRVINHPALSGKPFLLETPNELEGYAQEIKVLKDNYRL